MCFQTPEEVGEPFYQETSGSWPCRERQTVPTSGGGNASSVGRPNIQLDRYQIKLTDMFRVEEQEEQEEDDESNYRAGRAPDRVHPQVRALPNRVHKTTALQGSGRHALRRWQTRWSWTSQSSCDFVVGLSLISSILLTGSSFWPTSTRSQEQDSKWVAD